MSRDFEERCSCIANALPRAVAGLLALALASSACGESAERGARRGQGSAGSAGSGERAASGEGSGGVAAAGHGGADAGRDAAGGTGGAAAAGGTGGEGVGAGSGSAGEGGEGGDATSGEFLVLSYNVAGLPEALSGSEPAINMPFISPLLNDYDLVLTQEDWQEPDINPAALLGYHVYHDELAAMALHPYQSEPMPIPLGLNLSRPSALVSDGLNFFSNFPFAEPVRRVRWHDCFGDQQVGAADCLALKGFSVITLELASGVSVEVFTLHAEAGSTPEDQALQVADFEQLAEYIAENSADRAILIGGDTNLHTEVEEDAVIWRTFLERTGLTDVCATVDCGGEIDSIDKMAFRNNSVVTLTPRSHAFERAKFVRPTDGEPLSDHPPLVVRFGWAAAEER